MGTKMDTQINEIEQNGTEQPRNKPRLIWVIDLQQRRQKKKKKNNGKKKWCWENWTAFM